MKCRHNGFHSIRSEYDQRSGVLVYLWTCEGCGERLKEAHRLKYRPRYDPRGNEKRPALAT
jgi:hypothetical protein